MKDKVLSIQSRVAYGYVGSNIADLILQLQGIDIISIPTVLLSTHAENKHFMGESLSPTLFSKLLEGIDLLEAKNDINYMITGYFAEKKLMEIAYHFIKRLKAQTPFTYICDPVMGDYRAGGLYVKEEVADFYIQHLIELSDIITPNQFELEYILKEKIETEQQLLKLIIHSDLLVHKTVVVTSIKLNDTEEGVIETIIIANKKLVRIAAKKIDAEIVGTGDLFTALTTAQLDKGRTLEEAVSTTALFIEKVVKYLKENNLREMTTESIIKFSASLPPYINGNEPNKRPTSSTQASS